MLNRLSVVCIAIVLFSLNASSQTKGILPFTGIKYFSEGIAAKNIEVKVDGAALLNNRIPLNKEFEVRVISPSGFTEDRSKMIFAGAELNIVSMSGAVLSTVPNVFKDNEARGFPAASFKEIVVKLSLKPDLIKADPWCTVKLRYFDLKAKTQLRAEFMIVIARPGEVLQTTKVVNEIKAAAPTIARTNVVKASNVDVTVDTTIRVNPRMAYISLDIKGIDGTSIAEVMSGKESYWVYDADNLTEIKMTDKQLKAVNGAMENNIVNYLAKVPFRLKTVTSKAYIVRFRWESMDKRKLIDIVVTK